MNRARSALLILWTDRPQTLVEHLGALSEGGVSKVGIDIAEIGMIGEIEGLCPRLDPEGIMHMEFAAQCEIDLGRAKPTHEVSWRITDSRADWQAKGRPVHGSPTGILPAVDVNSLIGHDIDVSVICASRRWIGDVVSSEGDWIARSGAEAAIYSPATSERDGSFSKLECRQLPADSAYEVVAEIEIGIASRNRTQGQTRA